MKPVVARLRDLGKLAGGDELYHQLGMDKVLRDLGDEVAPPELHFLVDDDTQTIIQPAMLFLYANYGQSSLREDNDKDNTPVDGRQAAYELAEWLRFLAFAKRRWDKADHELIAQFAFALATRPSRHTGRKRKRPTIGHKLSTVYSFYRFMNATGLCSVSWDTTAIRRRYKKGKRARRLSDDEVRPFSVPDMKRLLKKLGPLPTERTVETLSPGRDRLLTETARLTGMRGEEICFLSRAAIRKLKPDPSQPDATIPLRITVTKGKDFRWVGLPNSLVSELQRHIKTERAEAVAELVARGGKDHGYVFVNQAGSRNSGAQLKTNSIHRRFRALMFELKMSRKVPKVIDKKKLMVGVTTHSFHDLRHTYAVNAYQSFLEANRLSPRNPPYPEPWKTVAVLLGHEDWHTTKHYLERAVGAREPLIGIKTHDYLEDA